MYERSSISQLAILSVLAILVALYSTKAVAQQSGSKAGGPVYSISALKSDFEKNTLSIDILGKSVPAYTVSERFAPFRVIVDIAGAVFEKSIDQAVPLIASNPVGKMSISSLPDQQQITRFEIEITDTHDYKVTRSGNDIGIIIAPAENESGDTAVQNLSSSPAITDFLVTTAPGETSILLAGTGSLKDFKVATLGGAGNKPARMFIDIADVTINELVREKKIGTSIDKIRVAPHGTGARIVFDSASKKLFEYDVLSTARGIQVIIDEKNSSISQKLQNVVDQTKNGVSDSTLDELIESSSNLLSKSQSAATGEPLASDNITSLQDDFTFSGYNKKRISVDFYKIDIHNVFRLFRKITDLNIIVDEGVQGTLTLALTDVPWDFALDIILNLQDLEKEERFNTIVIYPKKKEFAWPERAEDNLSFEANLEVVAQEALIIQQSANLPQEVMQAKELIRLARTADTNQDFEDAASLYEKAAVLWPTNTNIYNRLATLNLVQLGLNSKAVFFAKKSLKIDPKNSRAALYAAIGSANMQRISEASEFFTQAISNDPPLKEALFSFASFSETNNQNRAALKLMDKYHYYYGETVDTMLAKARILDKMGSGDKATAQYQAIIASGFQLRPDLKQYITGRLAAGNN